MAQERKQANFLNGVPELLILRLLADQAMYGYELVKAIRSSTDEAIVFGEGVVYPLLHALEEEGLLATRRSIVSGRPRVYYRVTAKGKRRLAKSAAEWRRISVAVTGVLGGDSLASPAV